MKNKGTLVWGCVLVALGVILGGNAIGLFSIDVFFKGWWTLFIIIPCFVSLFTEGRKELVGNLIGLAIGVCLLLASQGVFGFDMLWKILLPAVIVIIGLSLIFKGMLQGKTSEQVRKLNKEAGEKDELVAAFSGQKVKITKAFKAKTLSAVFGGIEFDMRDLDVKEDIVLNANAIFGGIDIFVPEGAKVETCSTSLFGGISDKRKNAKDSEDDEDSEDDAKDSGDGKKSSKKSSGPTIYIDATCMFGGVEIK